MANTVRVDEKGRLTIPSKTRKDLGLKPGDTFAFRLEQRESQVILHYAKVDDPFEGLAEHAVEEYRAGRTQSVEEVAREMGIDLDGETGISG